ncbi:hypothetical protein GLAREA_01167 [Glarea lozoyensis ATCC 20868]|uniref:Uncharacterized protein n=1 Tax=Glarea lozoyensis (strain ATCC 20868 / MF5171) TaxID=1116229 RepID=S3CUB8_GLAL2|nr:uncharacterized protein GLAREA_01167 [Glarea lozoyensis ATCC 20868]EPE30007.1 hypothetical protein GLAREA_01167 [Glarea lozoyensis ATCC 20868]
MRGRSINAAEAFDERPRFMESRSKSGLASSDTIYRTEMSNTLYTTDPVGNYGGYQSNENVEENRKSRTKANVRVQQDRDIKLGNKKQSNAQTSKWTSRHEAHSSWMMPEDKAGHAIARIEV